MTNEELVTLIQQGRDDMMLDLWEGVRRYAFKKVQRLCRESDHEDGMQAAFIALIDAVASFNPDKGTHFITWYSYWLTAWIWKLNGWRWKKNAHQAKDGTPGGGVVITDALNQNCISLNAPIAGDDDSDRTLMDELVDANAVSIDEHIAQKELSEIIDRLLKQLPKDSEEVIRRAFFDNIDLPTQAAKRGISLAKINRAYREGLRQLRRNHKLLEDFR